jgi:pimeloyl-ACP methyl ester carboxylesterase
MTRLTEPTAVGFRDIDTPSLRIYYPARSPGGRNAPVLPLDNPRRPYRPVLFVHGQREVGEGGLCPQDNKNDHRLWGTQLRLAARCGFVVIAVNVSDTNFSPAAAAQDALDGLAWVRQSWTDRAVLVEPPVFVDPTLPPPLPRVGVIGHSWGAKAAAQLALNRHVRCVVGVSGTFDDNESHAALTAANVPTLLIAVTEEDIGTIAAEPRNQPFCALAQPRHQLTLLGIGHWDLSEIGPCTGPRPAQAAGSRVIAAEAIVVFLHRYLYNANTLHPSLLSAPIGGRPPITPHVTGGGVCAVRSRWQDPFTGSSGETGLGAWPAAVEPWSICPTLTLSPTSLSFGQVATGTTATRTVRIKNPTQRAVTLSFPASTFAGFRWSGFSGTLPPNHQPHRARGTRRGGSRRSNEPARCATRRGPCSDHPRLNRPMTAPIRVTRGG